MLHCHTGGIGAVFCESLRFSGQLVRSDNSPVTLLHENTLSRIARIFDLNRAVINGNESRGAFIHSHIEDRAPHAQHCRRRAKAVRIGTGVTKARPREWDIIAGMQYLILPNLKLIGEYRHHEFEDSSSTPNTARLKDDGFTLRAMIAF